jgi:hypothetical protein
VKFQFPRVFGWDALPFGDRLKLMSFLAQAGAGMAMTVFAAFAMYSLADLKAVWPVFYLGFGALILVGIVTTGFAGLLIKRTLEVQGPGGFVFKSQDSASAQQAIDGVTATAQAMPAEPVKPEGTSQ